MVLTNPSLDLDIDGAKLLGYVW